MKIFSKIWQRIYHYFNPTYEERMRYLGLIDERGELTPEEEEEDARKLAELYRLIDEGFDSEKKDR